MSFARRRSVRAKSSNDSPRTLSCEEIRYRIYLREKGDRGFEDLRRGRVLTQEEVEQRMAKWLDE
jgi:hypothetical protein